jgi:tetratricopeptide (TPR) repeat protein
MNMSDFGRYAEAAEALSESVDRAFACDRNRQAAWSLSILGRLHFLRGESGEAIKCVDHCLELVRSERWTAFAPWPQTLRAELTIREGHSPNAEVMESLQGTFTLACQVADPCWEGLAARAIALVSSREGDLEAADRWIGEAQVRCNRTVDHYVWVQAHVMDGHCELLVEQQRLDEAAALAARMVELAARTEQREYLARALAYQGRSGDASALVEARAVADDVDNAALHSWLSA